MPRTQQTGSSSKSRHLALFIVIILVVSVLAVSTLINVGGASTPLPPVHQVLGMTQSGVSLNSLLIQIQSGVAGTYIPIAVSQGSGQICAQDLTTQASTVCTSSQINVPVNVGDQVTFSATPASGFFFDHFQAGGGAYPTTINPVTATIVAQPQAGVGYVSVYFDAVTGVQLGTFTQQWVITYDNANGQQYQEGPANPHPLVQAVANTNPPAYDPTRFWTVDVQIPITYSGGLWVGSCSVNSGAWDKAIITGTATVAIQNIQTTVNGQLQYMGTVQLGSLSALGVSFDPCSANPPTAGMTTKQMELWVTNTQAYSQLTGAAKSFSFDLQAALAAKGLQWLESFTLSVTMSETVSIYYTQCNTAGCNQRFVDQAGPQSLTYGVPWNPPAGLTTQATTTFNPSQTQTVGCQGATCTLQGTITQTITSVSTCYSYSGATACVIQTASTWTQTIAETVTQITTVGPPPPPNNGNLLLLLALLVGVFIVGAAFIVTYTQRRK